MVWVVGFLIFLLMYVFIKIGDRIYAVNLERERNLFDLTNILKANKVEIHDLRIEIRRLRKITKQVEQEIGIGELSELEKKEKRNLYIEKLGSRPTSCDAQKVWEVFLEYISYGAWERVRLSRNTSVESYDVNSNTYTVKISDREPMSEYDIKDKFKELYKDELLLELVYYNDLDEIRKGY